MIAPTDHPIHTISSYMQVYANAMEGIGFSMVSYDTYDQDMTAYLHYLLGSPFMHLEWMGYKSGADHSFVHTSFQAMENFNKGRKNKIPYSMMRAASNWSHKPLKKISEGVWGYMPLEPDHING